MAKFFKSIFAVCLCLTSFVFSQTESDSTLSNQETSYIKQGHGIEESQMVGIYNTPARYNVKEAFDVEVTGSFILWQALEEGLNIGSYADAGNRTHLVKFEPDYTPGFKLGATYNSDFDDWKIAFQYTRLYADDEASFNSTEVLATPLWIYNDSTADNEKISANRYLHLNYLDLWASRPFYSGMQLTLNAGFGLRSALNSQEIEIRHYIIDDNIVTVKTEDDNWLIGPKINCHLNFLLPYGLKVYAESLASLFYQKHDVTYNIADRDNPANNSSFKNSPSFLIPNMQIGGGLGWSSYFNNRSWHLELLLGYEMQRFWEQNVLRSIDDLVRLNTNGKHGDLTLHGLSFKLAVVF